MILVPATLPGRSVRNGLPEFRPYVYRGLGYDQLTPHIDAPVTPPDYPDPAPSLILPPLKRSRRRGVCNNCGYVTRGANHRALCGGKS